jgi:hypothetical protein
MEEKNLNVQHGTLQNGSMQYVWIVIFMCVTDDMKDETFIIKCRTRLGQETSGSFRNVTLF